MLMWLFFKFAPEWLRTSVLGSALNAIPSYSIAVWFRACHFPSPQFSAPWGRSSHRICFLVFMRLRWEKPCGDWPVATASQMSAVWIVTVTFSGWWLWAACSLSFHEFVRFPSVALSSCPVTWSDCGNPADAALQRLRVVLASLDLPCPVLCVESHSSDCWCWSRLAT